MSVLQCKLQWHRQMFLSNSSACVYQIGCKGAGICNSRGVVPPTAGVLCKWVCCMLYSACVIAGSLCASRFQTFVCLYCVCVHRLAKSCVDCPGVCLDSQTFSSCLLDVLVLVPLYGCARIVYGCGSSACLLWTPIAAAFCRRHPHPY
mgnify:CR=1 FL=1